jgi:hypothetical protein
VRLSLSQMIGDGDCGEIGGMKIVQGKPEYSEKKPAPSATLSTTNPTCLSPRCDWTLAAAVGSQRLTARAMALPKEWRNNESTFRHTVHQISGCRAENPFTFPVLMTLSLRDYVSLVYGHYSLSEVTPNIGIYLVSITLKITLRY